MANETNYADLTKLVLYCLEGAASLEEREQLERLLSEQPELIDHYFDIVVIYSGIHKPGASLPIVSETAADSIPEPEELFRELIEEAPVRQTPREAAPERRSDRPAISHRPGPREILMTARNIAALLLVSFTLVFLDRYFMQDRNISDTASEVVAADIAEIVEQLDAVWADDVSYTVGAALSAQRLRLESGYVRLAFQKGTRLLLEGPIDIQLENEDQIYLNRGVMSVTVPPEAVGFTVRTPNAAVVDYGTEFSIRITDNHGTEVYVRKGRVDVRNSSNPLVFEKSQRLLTGQAARADRRGDLRMVDADELRDMAIYDIPFFWNNRAGDGRWDNPANWKGGALPDSTTICQLETQAIDKACTITDSCVGRYKAVARRVNVGLDEGPCFLHINGGAAGFEQLWVGRRSKQGGFVTMRGGVLNLNAPGKTIGLFIGDAGYGKLTMEDGLISLHGSSLHIGRNQGNGEMIVNGGTIQDIKNLELGPLGGQGALQLNGGVLRADNIIIHDGICGIGADGRLILTGDRRTHIQNYISEGAVRTSVYPGRLDVVYDELNQFGFGNAKTIVRIVGN